MSHRHFCDQAGHYWECEGDAIRPSRGLLEPTPCLCLKHAVSMDDGDHSECPIELLACPMHRDQQRQQLDGVKPADTLGTEDETASSSLFVDKDGNATVGFCLWCNLNSYNVEEYIQHSEGDVCPGLESIRSHEIE